MFLIWIGLNHSVQVRADCLTILSKELWRIFLPEFLESVFINV